MFLRSSLFAALTVIFIYGCQSSEITSAKVYIQEKNWAKAYEQCKLATEKEPNNPHAWILLAQIYTEMDSAPGIVRSLDRALAIDPKLADEANRIRSNAWQKFFNKGVLAGRKNAFQEALNWTLIAYSIDSTKSDGPKQIAFFYRKLGDNEKAIRFYYRALELEPENELISIDLASALINSKQAQKAIPVLKALIEKKPKYAESYRVLGIAYSNLQKPDSAIVAYDGYINLEPKNEAVLVEQGALLYETNKPDSARKLFERALEINPQNLDAVYAIAVIDVDQDRLEDAEKRLGVVLEKEPNNYRAWSKLALVYQKKGRVKQANAVYQYAEGLAKEEEEDIESALQNYEKAVELDPDFLVGWKKLAKIYEQKNMTDKMNKAQEKIQRLEKK